MSTVENAQPRINDPAPRSVLAAARCAQNFTIAEVARQLKLSERQVEALEAGAFDKLPGRVFVRGFIRNYARLLKLDPDRVLASVNTDFPVAAERYEMLHSQDIPFPSSVVRRWPRYAIAATVVLAGLGAYELYWDERPTVTVTRPAAPPVAPAPVAAPAGQDVVQVAANAPAVQNATAEAAASDQSAARPSREASEAAPPAVLPQSGAQHGPEDGELHLVFEKDSWVEIRDREGRIIFTRLNRGGTEQRVRGKPPFTLVVGNARGVRLTYNDRPVNLERHIKVSIARLTLE